MNKTVLSKEIKQKEQQIQLQKLYNQCLQELISIGFNMSPQILGTIQIQLSKRSNKRYGCCRQQDPDERTKTIEKVGRNRYVKYNKYNSHIIEISKWVMELDDRIIKNTIIHEIIHCFPYCNNHGEQFKKYAKYINQKLGYNISRLGNKQEDYKKSNLEYDEKENFYKYTINCTKCGKVIHRKRLQHDFFKKYRCLCGGKLKLCQQKI